jgi:uncharacterized membrane protein
MSRRSRGARWISLGAYALLMLLLVVRTAGVETLGLASILTLVGLQLAPLLMLAPGLLRGAHRAYLWLCFVLMLFFLLAVDRIARGGPATLDVLEIAVQVTLFVAAMMFARWRARELAGAGQQAGA